MIKKSTWIVLAIMVAMVGGYVLLQQNDQVDFLTAEEPAPTEMPGFVSLDGTTVDSILFSRPEEEDVILTKQSDDTWNINVPGGSITAGNIEEILSEFNAIKTTVLLSVDVEGAATGLNDPQYTFTIGSGTGNKEVIKIGNANPLGSGYYAQVNLNQAVIISQGGIDNIVELLQTAMTPATPTPVPTATAD
ncbi:MAG: DUF4340 domain-containing protein [Anaerolineaceae bacterium]|jgi:hypothetical protein